MPDPTFHINTGRGRKRDKKTGRIYIDSKPDEDWSPDALAQEHRDKMLKAQEKENAFRAAEERVPESVRARALELEARGITDQDHIVLVSEYDQIRKKIAYWENQNLEAPEHLYDQRDALEKLR